MTPGSGADAIPWVRKRDGGIVPFDVAKLASSIFAAHEQVNPENPAFVAQELTQAVIHFLAEETSGTIPTTDEVADVVVKVLRELGQGPTAQAFHDAGKTRQQRREEIEILPEDSPNAAVPSNSAPAAWNKTRLVERLEADADLEASLAREVAAAVERRLLAVDLGRVTPGLVDELVYCELFHRGMEKRWSGRRGLSVPMEVVHRSVLRLSEPGDLVRWAGQELLREYARREVFSRDVAGLIEEGVLRLLGHSCPVHWSARSVSLGELGQRFSSIDQALSELASGVSRHLGNVSTSLALEALDAWLALSAAESDSPAYAARRMCELVHAWSDREPRGFILNFFQQVPQEISTHWSRGGLFGEQGGDRYDGWARDFDEALAEQLKDQAPRCRLDLHLDALSEAKDLDGQIRRGLQWAGRGTPIGFAMDRPTWTSGEGLFVPLGQSAGVVEYVGIDLASVLDRCGVQDDGTLFFRRLDIVCESILRLGLQKREFLRQRAGGERPPALHAMAVCPLRLDQVVERLVGQGSVTEEIGWSMAERILRRLAQRLARESKPYRLPCRLDSVGTENVVWEISLGGSRGRRAKVSTLLRGSGRLHGAMGGGTTLLRLSESSAKEEPANLVSQAARDTATCRLLLATSRPDRQPNLFD